MADEKKLRIEFNEYLKMLFNFTRCGDLTVIGMAILENKDKTLRDLDLTCELVKKSIEYLLKRHALLRAHIETDDDTSKVYFSIDDNDPKWSQVVVGQDLVYGKLNTRNQVHARLESLVDKRLDYKVNCKLWRAGLFSFPVGTGSQECNQSGCASNQYALVFLLPLYMTDALNITSLTIELVNLINSLVLGIECEEMRVQLPLVDTELNLIRKENLIGQKQIENIIEMKSLYHIKFTLIS